MELHFGSRNTRTGLTGLKGQLDDHGVGSGEKGHRRVGRAPPHPRRHPRCDAWCDTQRGLHPDPRPSATRLAHALVEALERYLTAGAGPSNGGEKPQVVILRPLGSPER